jgi:uncharacterized protein YukE
MNVGEFLNSGNSLRVNTDVMMAKAREVEQKVREMRNEFAEMERMINETRNHWMGEAGDLHRSLFFKKKEDIDRILNKLAQHPVNLQEAARVYVGLANENDQVQRSLPTDVIS